MYTEIKELVNFLSRYMHFRLPRYKVCLYTEQLGNALVLCYHRIWDTSIQGLTYVEDSSRMLHVKVNGLTSDIFLLTAREIGLEPDEVLACLPERLLLYVNPGEVFYCEEKLSKSSVLIWKGDVNEDDRYLCQPQCVSKPTISNRLLDVAGQPTLIGKIGAFDHSTYLGLKQLLYLDDTAMADWHVPLTLCHPREVGYEQAILSDELSPTEPNLMFRYTPPNALMTFTTESFSATRFGSHRIRPDHELMRKIQVSAKRKMPSNLDTTLPREILDYNLYRELSAWPTATGGGMSMLSSQNQPLSQFPSSLAYAYTPFTPSYGYYSNCLSSHKPYEVATPAVSTSLNHIVPSLDFEALKTLSPAQKQAVGNLLKKFQALNLST